MSDPSDTKGGVPLPSSGAIERGAEGLSNDPASSDEPSVPKTQAATDLAARARAGAGDVPPATAEADGQAPPSASTEPEEQPAEVNAGTESTTDFLPSSLPSEPPVSQVLAPHWSEEQEAARRKDKRLGLIIIGVVFVGCILVSLWGKEASEPMQAEPPGPPTTEGVVGWPNQVDANGSLSAARAATPRREFRGFVAEHVVPDGTIDFKKKGALIRYSFQSAPGEGPQPPREPGTLARRSYCGRQNVFVRRYGLVADADMSGFPCSAQMKDPLPDPACSLKDVWDYMRKNKRVTQQKPARIEYYMAKHEPAYRFTLPGTPHHATLSADCRRELSLADGLGGVP